MPPHSPSRLLPSSRQITGKDTPPDHELASAPPVHPGNLTDEDIYTRLHTAIARQQLPPGTRLREDEIRQIFGVSRARIRTVFSRLAHTGIVTLEPNRGASVTRPSVREAKEIFAARRAIEGTIVREAVQRASKRDIARMREHLSREKDADHRRDRAEMIRLSGEFHLLIAEIAGNDVLRKFLADLITRESLVILTYEQPGRPSCSQHEHEHILDAFAQGQADTAAGLMIAHLDAIEGRLDFGERQPAAIDLASILTSSDR